MTRGEWAARWWQWLSSLPEDVSPGFDTTGERCGYGQSGPVFFLPGDWTGAEEWEITCVVAEGTAIYVFVWGAGCSTAEPPPFFGRTEDELRECATTWADGVSQLQVRINGQDVADPEAYRTASPLFTITFPEDNIIGAEPGVAQAVSEDYSLLIAPPPPGQYEIAISWRYAGDEFPSARTVNVNVEAPQVIESPPTTT